MGGVGKTELALQYAISQFNLEQYPGGVCWLRARGQEIAPQITSFTKIQLGLSPTEGLSEKEQTDFCWKRMPEGNVLVILDDVTNFDAVKPYLPPFERRFKVLITTRLNLICSDDAFNIEVLSDESALKLLESLLGTERIQSQMPEARELCNWVGNLPLGLELLGRYLSRKLDLSIQKLLERLDSKRLDAKALVEGESIMTAQLGVAAALELSWAELNEVENEVEKELACLLGMFAIAPIPWTLVERCMTTTDVEDLEDIRDRGLTDRNLLKRESQGSYQLHQIVQEFYREKLEHQPEKGRPLKETFCRVMVEVAKSIDDTPTVEQREKVRNAVAHLEEACNKWSDFLEDENLIWPYVGISRFHEGQGNYKSTEFYRQECLSKVKLRFGKEHTEVATSSLGLALLYHLQGQYEEAEYLYKQALHLRTKLLGEEHPLVANSLLGLAELYDNQGLYQKAKPLYQQAVKLRRKLLTNKHPDVAQKLDSLKILSQKRNQYYDPEYFRVNAEYLTVKKRNLDFIDISIHISNIYAESSSAMSFDNSILLNINGRHKLHETLYQLAIDIYKNQLGDRHPFVADSLKNLATFYNHQGQYEEAEPLYKQALQKYKNQLGDKHPYIANILNDLAALYDNQGRYKEAESLYVQALEMRQHLQGEKHPSVANTLNNLAALYEHQGRYKEAEPLYKQSLNMFRELFGDCHLFVSASLNNIAEFYDNQGRYKEAETLYKKSLNLKQKLLGEKHPFVSISFWHLSIFYKQQGDQPKAINFIQKALQIAETKLGQEHPQTQAMREHLSRIQD